LSSRLAFAAVEMAGRLISTEIGLSAAPGMGVPEPASEPLAAMLSALPSCCFFSSAGTSM
jgi:flagellar biosynthetic protein FliR